MDDAFGERSGCGLALAAVAATAVGNQPLWRQKPKQTRQLKKRTGLER